MKELEPKFIVINKKQLKELSVSEIGTLGKILNKLDFTNEYMIVNTDEPYAEMVKELILTNELSEIEELKKENETLTEFFLDKIKIREYCFFFVCFLCVYLLILLIS